MKKLILSDWGTKIRVSRGRLLITDMEKDLTLKPGEQYPKINGIICCNPSGYITLEALHWLARENIQLNILQWDGSLIGSLNLEKAGNGKRKITQYQAFINEEKKLFIAKEIIKVKLLKSKGVLESLPFPNINSTVLDQHLEIVEKVKDVSNLLGIEGEGAKIYWNEYRKAIPEKWGFEGRGRGRGAFDYTNTMLNYGYSLLEADCLKVINTIGLDPCIGFLHEPRNEKKSLVYDLQELFRSEVDIVVYRLLSKGFRVSKTDFLRMNNGNLRLRELGVKKLVLAYETRMNERIEYKGKNIPRKKIIERKGFELAQFLEKDREELSFI